MKLPGPLFSERLIVRPFQNGDQEGFIRFMTHPEATQFLTFTNEQKTESGAKQLFYGVIGSYFSEDPVVALCIADRKTNEFVGSYGLSRLESQGEIECYDSLFPKYWKMGFAQEAMNVLIRYAFKEMSVSTIVAFVHPDNYLAQRLAARFGLLRIGVILHPEHRQDCLRYALENHSEYVTIET